MLPYFPECFFRTSELTSAGCSSTDSDLASISKGISEAFERSSDIIEEDSIILSGTALAEEKVIPATEPVLVLIAMAAIAATRATATMVLLCCTVTMFYD
uniref:Uncharacterized protein n=2 Tax=Odontella aurita TaxID=265563 RepID=A0A6U6IS76_9STRA